MRIVGIDIGKSGAAALIDSETGELLAVEDLPVLQDGPKGRPAINAPLLAATLGRWGADQAFIEFVGARPGEAPSGAFAFGRCRGVVEGVLGALAVPVSHITPPCWKRTIGIPPGRDGAKDLARGEAIRRWPRQAELFARKGDDGRAEAALIAVAGVARGRR